MPPAPNKLPDGWKEVDLATVISPQTVAKLEEIKQRFKQGRLRDEGLRPAIIAALVPDKPLLDEAEIDLNYAAWALYARITGVI